MSKQQEPAPRKRRRRAAEEEQDVPLGSLSQRLPVPSGTETCLPCGATLLTRVPMSLGDGTAVTFVSCPECEDRVWVTVDGDRLGLVEVLGRAERQ